MNLGILFALFFAGILILYPSIFLFFNAHSGISIKECFKDKKKAREVLWFNEPDLPAEKIGSWEIGMWAFLVLYLVINTLGSVLS